MSTIKLKLSKVTERKLRLAVSLLNSLDLSIYGPTMTDDGCDIGCCVEYDEDAVVLRAKFIYNDMLLEAVPE